MNRLIISLAMVISTVSLGGSEFINLGTLGGIDSAAMSINDDGMIAGHSTLSNGKRRAFIWTDSNGMMDIDALLSDDWSRASGINDAGQVVGTYGGSYEQAFLYQSDSVQNLGTLGGSRSEAVAINSNTFITGYAEIGGSQHACLWIDSNDVIDLGTLGGSNSHGLGLNDSLHVVGSADATNGSLHAFVWEDIDGVKNGNSGIMYDLATPDISRSSAWDINENGSIVGFAQSSLYSGQRHACLWDSNRVFTDLGTLPGGNWSEAYAINDSGWIVGEAKDASGTIHAVIWDPNHTILDLNTLLPEDSIWAYLQVARDINNDGTVVGYGYLQENNQRRAFLMQMSDSQSSIVRGIEIEFVPIGHAGNDPDSTGFGAVAYDYSIGKYEVTNEQWNTFVAAAGKPTGQDDAYRVDPYFTGDLQPTGKVSFYEAAQFCNYLTTGNKYDGVYKFADGYLIDIMDHTEAAELYGAAYFVPSEDEWYKAAYYTGSGYSLYANGTNIAPSPAETCYNQPSPFIGPWNVGTGAEEQNGTYDMMGNFQERVEITMSSIDSTHRGGAYYTPAYQLVSTYRLFTTIYGEGTHLGFRVAAIVHSEGETIIPLEMVYVEDPGVGGHNIFIGYMGKYEVTNAQYCEFLNAALASGDIIVSGNDVLGADGSNSGVDFAGQRYYNLIGPGYTYDGAVNGGAAWIDYIGGVFTVEAGLENHPVTYVTWYGATAFCYYYGYHLPTEWEWQAVADYDGSYIYGCGTAINNSIANYIGSNHPYGTTTVGQFGEYGYEMCDLAGNVIEWTDSIYIGIDPVIRGGTWTSTTTAGCRVDFRGSGNPSIGYKDVGFRVCQRIAIPPDVDAGSNIQILSADQMTTVIVGMASDPDDDSLDYRWYEGDPSDPNNILLYWTAVDPNGFCPFDLGTLPYLSVGNHTLTLEVSDGQATASDEMILTIDNSPPEAQPAPSTQVVEIGVDSIIIVADVSDFDGDFVTYNWLKDPNTSLAAGTVKTIQGGDSVAIPDLTAFAGDSTFPLGLHQLELRVDDGINDPVSKYVSVSVNDTQAPSISPIPNTTILCPPNHKLHDIVIQANAFDNGGGEITLTVEVESSEPPDADGDGNTIPDFYIDSVDSDTGLIALRLRAERSGKGEGRVYTITITATDASGNISTAKVEITAPHNKSKK